MLGPIETLTTTTTTTTRQSTNLRGKVDKEKRDLLK